MQRMPLDRLTTNTKNHVTMASTARMGKEDFQKETHINIPPVSFVSAFSIQKSALPCKDAGPQKSRGGLPRSKPPRMGYIPLYLMEASRDRIPLAACQIRS